MEADSARAATTRAPAGGLRARKRAETHVALVEAALELFAEQGYEETTVEQVAARAGVSPRTAYRYFPSKVELVLGEYRAELRRWADTLEATPAGESLDTAVRAATQAVVTDYFRREAFWDRVRTLVETTPELAAPARRIDAELQDAAARVIARRIGTDPASDPRPHVLAAAAMAAVSVATRAWYESGKAIDYAAEVDAALDRLADLDRLLATPLR